VIIVEGMDNTGKTTLVDFLSGTFKGLKRIKSPGPPKDVNSITEWTRDSLLYGSSPTFIYDRHPLISEKVYGPLLRGKDCLDHSVGRLLFKDFLRLKPKPLIIYCRPSIKAIKRYGSRGQMEGVIPNTEKLVEAYDKLMRFLSEKEIEVFHYNYETKTDRVLVVNRVYKYLNDE